MTARKPAKKSPAKRKPRPKKTDPAIEFSDLSPKTQKRLAEIIDSKHNPSDDPLPSDGAQAGYAFPAWATYFALSAVSLIIGGLVGVFACGGIPIGPDAGPDDAVSIAFAEYEKLWRATQAEAANKLESGEFTTSQQVTEYRSMADGKAIKATRQPLLDAEFADHGGEKWTAEKQAKFLRRYAE